MNVMEEVEVSSRGLEDPTGRNLRLEEQDVSVSSQSTLSALLTGARSVAYDVSSYWAQRLYETLISPRDPRSHCQHAMESAASYEEWAESAKRLDELEGKNKWKNEVISQDYDYDLLQARLSQLRSARYSNDLQSTIFLLRTSLARNLGDMGQSKLYAHTHIGTKKLIEVYINEVVQQLKAICDPKFEDMSAKAKLEFVTNTRQSFGRTALLLSGGATFGLAHLGVIKALNECKLLPRIISGASSGSIIAAFVCTKTDEELPQVLSDVSLLDLNVFEKSDDPDAWHTRLDRFVETGVLFDVEILRECMRRNIGDMTFQEAYNRTRRILNITVSSSTVYETHRLLNYLTAPNVLIWSAVAASCSVPFIYSSAPLMAKDVAQNIVPWTPSGQSWIDGSVENDLPMDKLSELYNVNHFIVCQVNPHVVPFLQTSLIPSPVNRVAGLFLYLAISELQHRLNQLNELGVMRSLIHRIQAIMSQRYCGDITIVPKIAYTDFLNLLSNPTSEVVRDATLRGERATWPKISIIRNHCQIELTLDEIMLELRRQLLDENDPLPSRESGDLDGLDLETPRRDSCPGNVLQADRAKLNREQRPRIQPFSEIKDTTVNGY